MAGGRPTIYTEELGIAICERIADGESVASICRDEAMPASSAIYRWIPDHPEFKERYEKAKEDGLQVIAEELLDIADNGSNDWMTKNDPDNPGFLLNGESIQRARLRVDTRKWLLSKLAMKTYGDVSRREVSGPGGGPIQTQDVTKLSDEELDAIIDSDGA